MGAGYECATLCHKLCSACLATLWPVLGNLRGDGGKWVLWAESCRCFSFSSFSSVHLILVWVSTIAALSRCTSCALCCNRGDLCYCNASDMMGQPASAHIKITILLCLLINSHVSQPLFINIPKLLHIENLSYAVRTSNVFVLN